MTKSEIVGEIAKSGIVENLISTMKASVGEDRDNLKDLAQDIYLSLLDKPDGLIQSLWESGEYKFYVTRMIVNNICSSSSPYDKIYRAKKPDYEIDTVEDAKY